MKKLMYLRVLIGVCLYIIFTIPMFFGVNYPLSLIIICGVTSSLLSFVIVEYKDKIKKFFTPYKWETIWTCKAKARTSTFGFETGRVPVTIVIQQDNYKNAWRCYMTDGSTKTQCDINVIVSEYPELKGMLLNKGIRI